MIDWLLSTGLTSLALAVLVAMFIWFGRPNPAVRHALWLVVMLKLVIPSGLFVQVPLPFKPPAPVAETLPSTVSTETWSDEVIEVEHFVVPVSELPDSTINADELMLPTTELLLPASPKIEQTKTFPWRTWVMVLWAVGAVVFAVRQFRETWRFQRFARSGLQGSPELLLEVDTVARQMRVRPPAVRVLGRLSSPMIWCPWRPVLLWPAGLEKRLTSEGRRAVLAHELAHLRRRDHWSRRLEMLASILHWWNPVFWIARKRLRNDAELACDAWATGQASPRTYAEALLAVCSFENRRRPTAAVAASGEGRRAMQERLTMIMREGGQCRLAFGAKLVVALMGIAAIPAWTLGQSKPLVEVRTADPDLEKIESQIKLLQEKLAAVRMAKVEEAKKKAEAAMKAAHSKVHDKSVVATTAAPGTKVVVAGQDGYKVIGPDGKERKDVKIIIVDKVETKNVEGQPLKVEVRSFETKPVDGQPHKVEVRAVQTKPAPGTPGDGQPLKVEVRALDTKPAQAGPGHFELYLDSKAAPATARWTPESRLGVATVSDVKTIALTRATYKLNKEQASTLATLLGNVKGQILEVKAEGESITITTTPELQSTLGQLIRLMNGQPTNYLFRATTTPPMIVAPLGEKLVAPVAPSGPARPAVIPPAPPAPPVKPLPPESTAKPTEKRDVILELKKDVKNMEADALLKKLQDLLGSPPAKTGPGK